MTENLNPKQKNVWRWLLIIGTVEAISFLILLFIAVPIKYLGGNPAMVKMMGPIHGTFFLLYVAMVISAARSFRWRAGRVWLALLASVIPCGPFIFDAWLRRQADAFGTEDRCLIVAEMAYTARYDISRPQCDDARFVGSA